MAKITKEKWKTYQNVFDEFTLRNLFKFESQGHFEQLKSPIMIGKEANIFSASTKQGNDIIIKIYRLESCDFRRMYEYIKYDERYVNMKRSRRQVIFSWTQREFRNLMIARDLGVRVPTPFTFKDNIILMEQVGKPSPAPQLKDYFPSDADKFFNKIIHYVSLLWAGGLVHGDLSQFNILNDDNEPVFLDFSQGTISSSTMAKEYLLRDITNITNFFKKLNLTKDPSEIIAQITSKK